MLPMCLGFDEVLRRRFLVAYQLDNRTFASGGLPSVKKAADRFWRKNLRA